MKEFLVKQSNDFRLKVRMSKCSYPKDLNHLEFIQEQLNDLNQIRFQSTYQFFLTNEQIETLCKGLLNDNHQD